MRPPPLHVRLLGHPVVMVTVTFVAGLSIYGWTQHGEMAVPALLAIVLFGVVGKASQHRMNHVRWRQAWNAMADGGEPSPRGPLLAKLAVAIIVPAGFVVVENGVIDPGGKPAAWALLAILVAICWAMILRARRWLAGGAHEPAHGRSRSRRARNASRSDVVSICARSSMRVPSLEEAYRALPAHCWRLLNPGAD